MKLVVIDGPMKGHEFRITKPTMDVGRKRENDVPLPLDPRVSRFHCRLTYADGRYFIEDLNSGNGTFVGNVRIEARSPLPTGTLVRIGRTHLALQEESAADLQRHAERSINLVSDEQVEGRMEVARILDPQAIRSGWAEAAPSEEAALAKLQRKLTVFQEVADALSDKLDHSEVLNAIMDALMSAVPAERGFLLLVDEKAKTLTPRVVRTGSAAAGDEQIAVSRAMVSKAVDERVSLLISDALADERFKARDSVMGFQIRSALCVPLLHQDRVLAVIYLMTTSAAHVFSQDDLELVTDIANQAAIALANAQLYTELRNAYEELRATQDQLVRREKLSVIGTLSASIAHDIGNVITPISAIAEMAIMDQGADPELQATVERQVHRLRALTRRLLSFSRPQEVEMLPADVNQIIHNTLELLNTEARRAKVDLVEDLAPDLPPVLGDATQLDQVFVNLAINAIQAMEDRGGRLTIATACENSYVEVQFEDEGPGIPPDQIPHVFEPFYTTKGDQGTGLGLFSCRRIIEEDHGGELLVASELGKGTTFTVRLPIRGPSAPDPAD
jgi:two-component system NtrC family sensor kinase